MHIILGGAANGKRRFVREQLTGPSVWLGTDHPLDLSEAARAPQDATLVLCGLEQWMAGRVGSEQQAAADLLVAVRGRKAVVILTDIGRGIVPADPEARALRDACGRLAQRLTAEAETVTRIWFGIAQKLK